LSILLSLVAVVAIIMAAVALAVLERVLVFL
jgi:hypothetical protein